MAKVKSSVMYLGKLWLTLAPSKTNKIKWSHFAIRLSSDLLVLSGIRPMTISGLVYRVKLGVVLVDALWQGLMRTKSKSNQRTPTRMKKKTETQKLISIYISGEWLLWRPLTPRVRENLQTEVIWVVQRGEDHIYRDGAYSPVL
jgi:hypothetical protein